MALQQRPSSTATALLILLFALVAASPFVRCAELQLDDNNDSTAFPKGRSALPKRCGEDEPLNAPLDVGLFDSALVENTEMNVRQRRDVGILAEDEVPYSLETRSTYNWNQYHDYASMTQLLQSFVATYASAEILNLYEIGTSTRNRKLWVMEVGTNAGANPRPRKLEFRYSANMHGDEVVGRELCLRFIDYLCSEYVDNNPAIRKLLETTSIHILPSMNPDGFEQRSRGNARNVDLNRNFPDQFESSSKRDLPVPQRISRSNEARRVREAETEAVMRWALEHNFVLCANFHGGSVVANYPFDGNRQHRSGQYSSSPDDSLFKSLALSYSLSNPTMRSSHEFRNGIVNGAQWYVLYGGMQDWHYLHRGCFELTIELSDIKWPNANELGRFWDENKDSMVKYVTQAHRGIKGTVTDARTNSPIVNAVITIDEHAPEVNVYTNSYGDYYRPLLAGTYTVKVSAPGFISVSRSVTVDPNSLLMADNAVNFDLNPSP